MSNENGLVKAKFIDKATDETNAIIEKIDSMTDEFIETLPQEVMLDNTDLFHAFNEATNALEEIKDLLSEY